MKTVNAQTITETIAHLCIDANRNLPKDVAAALHQAEEDEPFAPAKDLLSLLTKKRADCPHDADAHLSGYRHGGRLCRGGAGSAY